MTATLPELQDAPTLRVRLGDPRIITEILSGAEVLTHGHFELLGGEHADAFIRFSRVADRQPALDATAQWLLPSVTAWLPDAVLAPATAGVALGWTLARRLGLPLVLADVGDDGRAVCVREADSIQGRRVLLINDVVTTGEGMGALAQVARAAGAEIAGGAWFLSRSDVDVSQIIDAPVSSIGELLLARWSRESCPLCVRGEAITPALEIN
jgi:orotate phosphoribosyltransferase